jgi:hypothetical protein
MFTRTLIVVLTAAVATSVLASSSAPAAPSRSFTLTASLDRRSLAREGTSPANTIVFSTSLRRAGKPDGRGEFVQTIVDPRYRGISMRADLLLADGTLELQGAGLSRRAPGAAKPASQTDMAIVGGTGAYAGATGTVQLTPIGPTTQRLFLAVGS